MKHLLLSLSFFFAFSHGYAQQLLEPSKEFNKKRTIAVSTTSGLFWAGSITALNYVWYKDFDKSGFHFFDDSKEWGQMDKMGHLYTSWQFAGLVNDLYKWAGVDHKKSALISGGFSLGYMTTFELLDAYNTKWGFSWSDIGFNTLGTAVYTSQAYFFDKQYVHFKFSFHESGLADYRPNVLGSDFASRTLKDYNGQTYWISMNPFSWSTKNSKVPEWLNLSLGYSINDQLIGDGGTYIVADGANQLSFTPYRQYFLSLDVDFTKIPVESRLLKLIFRGLNTIKVPFPALEFSQGALTFHPLYF